MPGVAGVAPKQDHKNNNHKDNHSHNRDHQDDHRNHKHEDGNDGFQAHNGKRNVV